EALTVGISAKAHSLRLFHRFFNELVRILEAVPKGGANSAVAASAVRMPGLALAFLVKISFQGSPYSPVFTLAYLNVPFAKQLETPRIPKGVADLGKPPRVINIAGSPALFPQYFLHVWFS